MSRTHLAIIVGISALLIFHYLAGVVRRRFYSARGLRIERKAIESLKLPEDWSLRANVPVPGCGDADIVITDPFAQKWVVEIKSYEGAKKVLFPWFSRREIVRRNKQPFERDSIEQILRTAGKLRGSPVLWMPLATPKTTFRTRSGVLVVQGGRRKLEKAVGIKRWFA